MFARVRTFASTAFVAGALFSTANAQSSSAIILPDDQTRNSTAPVPIRALFVTDFAYPLPSIIVGEEGTSKFNLIVDTLGGVTFAQLLASSGSSRLDQAGLQVAKTQWQFEPAKRDGESVVGSLQVEINWKLPARPADEFVSNMIGVPVARGTVMPPSLNREAYRLTSADYPPASARAGEIGEVALKVLVLEDGSVGDVQLFDSSGHARLDERAIAIAREKFKYKPGTVDGKPTAMWLDVLHAFLGTRDRRSPPPPNALYRFCHSRPIVGTTVDVTSTDRGQDVQDGPTLVLQWIHLTADGSVDDVIMATSRGWVHLSETLVSDYTRAARQRAAVPDRPPSCWYNGSGLASAEPPKAVSVSELSRRGGMYLRQGKLAEALSDFDKAVEIQPSNAIFLNNRCYVLALMGRAQEALADCEKSLNIRARVPATLDSRGFVYLLLEKYDAAISDYTAVLRQYPKQASSLYGRGIAKIRMGNEAEGRADIAEAMNLDQNITERMSSFGFVP